MRAHFDIIKMANRVKIFFTLVRKYKKKVKLPYNFMTISCLRAVKKRFRLFLLIATAYVTMYSQLKECGNVSSFLFCRSIYIFEISVGERRDFRRKFGMA